MNVLSDCKITIKMSEHGNNFVFFLSFQAHIYNVWPWFYGRREGCATIVR